MKEQDIESIFQIFNEIGIVSQLSSTLLEKGLPLGIKASQFKVLNHFSRLGDGQTPASLAKSFQVTKGAMTNTINRLLSLDLVSVEEDNNDRRAKRIYITDKGREIREQAIKGAIHELTPLKQVFTEEELANALPFLTKLRCYLDDNR
ncbi:MarR family winged helix-turn-helix transcriptional regulator [Shewanella sp. A14]